MLLTVIINEIYKMIKQNSMLKSKQHTINTMRLNVGRFDNKISFVVIIVKIEYFYAKIEIFI